MKAKDPHYRDLMRDGIATRLLHDIDADEQAAALAFTARQFQDGAMTAVQARHAAEALGLVPARKGRIWDADRQAFVQFVRARRTTKFGQVHA